MSNITVRLYIKIKSKLECEIISPIKNIENSEKLIQIDSDAFDVVHSSDEVRLGAELIQIVTSSDIVMFSFYQRLLGTFHGVSKALKRPTYKDKGRSNTGRETSSHC